jgi:hypothetical protein
MNELFAAPNMLPFTIALVVVLAILALEIIGFIVGFSSFNDNDVDADFDIDADFDVDVDFDLDADLEVAFGDHDVDLNIDTPVGSGVWSFLEFGKVPLLVWILSFSGGFAMSGFAIQMLTNSILGFTWWSWIAVAMAIVPTMFIGKFFAQMFALIVPKSTTQAISASQLGGRTGSITVGTADTGNPAPATVKDHNGNTHSIRVVPFKGEPALPQGTEIVVLRGAKDGVFQAMSLHKAKERYNS